MDTRVKPARYDIRTNLATRRPSCALTPFSIGINPPHEGSNVIHRKSRVGGEPIKYEMETRTPARWVVDRFLYLPRCAYPGNYGFNSAHPVGRTGDPCDVLVANTRAILPGEP